MKISKTDNLPQNFYKFVFQVIRKFKFSFTLGLIGCSALALENLLLPYAIKLIVDGISTYESGVNIFLHLKQAIIFLCAAWLGIDTLWRVAGFGLAHFVASAEAYIKEAYNISFLMQKKSFFRKYKSGDLFGKVIHTATELPYIIEEFFYTTMPCFVNILGALYIATNAHSDIGKLIATWLMLHFIVSIFFFKVEIRLANHFTRSSNNFHAIIKDTMDNNMNVRLFNSIKSEKRIFKLFSIKQKRDSKKMRHLDQVMLLTIAIIAFIFNGLFLTYLLITNYAKGTITIGDVAMIFYLMKDLAKTIIEFNIRFGEIIRLFGMMRYNYEFAKHIEHEDKSQAITESRFSSNNGNITISNLYYQHNKNPLFENLNLEIKSGEKVAIVGESGSGKSTLIGLLLKEYIPDNGSISIDGHNLAKYKQSEIVRHISYVPQQPMLLNRSILENIKYAKPSARFGEVVEICKKIGLHYQIMNLPNQYEEVVGEMGMQLSGGQRQRISIARAMLLNSSIFIFDEATSALDIESELEIRNLIAEIATEKTVITIAHRISTIMSMERIIVIDKGKVIQDGTHNDLIKDANGAYHRIIKMHQEVL